MATSETEVLIVGAGPTGLTLANILGMHGVRAVLVERNAATVGEPRAVSIDDESLRTMQYIDLIDAVRGSIVQGYGSHYFSPKGKCFAKVLPDIMEYGYARRSAFRQPVLEAQLREGLKRFASVQTRFSSKVTRLEDDGDSVRAGITRPDGAVDEVRCQYVAACDGGRSGIREALGIKMGGSTYDEKWLIVDLADSTDPFRHTRVFCDPARPGLALPGPEGTRRYEFMMLPGEKQEELLEEGFVRRLLSRYSEEDARLPITRKVIYHFHARIAERWRAGRIFLAGDAAHLTPPFAGQGMNSGVRDAQNLGWKLVYCLRGGLGRGALESYESERKPHAWALIQMAVKMGHVMMPSSRVSSLLTQAAFRTLSLYRPARDYVMQMKYKPQPFYRQGLIAGDAGRNLRGRMFGQPLVELRDGTRVLFDTILDKGFAIVELDDGKLPLAAARADRSLDAKALRIIPHDHRFLPRENRAVEQVRDVTGTIGKVFDRAQIRGVILRPDRYVACCLARASGADEADRSLDALVRLSNSPSQATVSSQSLDLAIA
jgi:3-(3-hydroxy-phenyl)propionate hydroxylase